MACKASLSMGFSRQEYWSGWPFRSPGHRPDPGIEPRSPALQANSGLGSRQNYLSMTEEKLEWRCRGRVATDGGIWPPGFRVLQTDLEAQGCTSVRGSSR